MYSLRIHLINYRFSIYPSIGKNSEDKKEKLKNLVLRYGTEIILVKNIKQDSLFVEGLQLYDK